MSGIYLVYTWYIPGISYPTVNHAVWVLSSSCPGNPCSIHLFPIHPAWVTVLIASLKPCKTKGSLKQVYVTYIPCIYSWYMSCIHQVCLVHSFEGELCFLIHFWLQHFIVLNHDIGMQHWITTHKHMKWEFRYPVYTWYMPYIYRRCTYKWNIHGSIYRLYY